MRKAWPAGRQGFALPLILIALASIFITGIIYFRFKNKSSNQTAPAVSSPASPDAYSGWKTYRNSTHGFSIRYPKEWFIKSYQDYAADFLATDLQNQEASPGAVKVRYLHLTEKVDLDEFEKIQKSEAGKDIYEPLDVKSVINKVRNLEMGGNPTIEFYINRKFSALEGPKTEFSHVYEIKKDETILKFFSYALDKDSHLRTDPIFQKMISSLKF